MTHAAPPEPVVVPLPPEFPVVFDPPELVALPFQQDRQHVPAPMTPLSAWFAKNGFAVGASRALATNNVPMAFTVGHFNYYYYMAVAPNVPPEMMPELEAKAEQSLLAAVPRFHSRWNDEWLPALQQLWSEWAAFDLDSSGLPRLLDRLDESLEVFQRIWQIHFELLVPAMIGFSEFREMYHRLFPEAGALDAYRLLQGFDNNSLAADRAFYGLAQRVAASSSLRDEFAKPGANLRESLAGTEQGRAFLSEMEAVLSRWGKRSDTVQELSDPSWTEDPTPLFNTIRSLLEKGEDPHQRHQEMARQRDQAVAEARAALAGQPPEIRGQFEGLLAAAQACSFLQEDHNHWIDQRGLHEVRQVCMEVGRRLAAAGLLENASDVFLFEPAELRALAESNHSGKETATARRGEMEAWAKVAAPPMVGTDYGPPPDNPVTRALMRFFGGPPPASEGRLIRGNAGSSGVVRGVARVIMTIDEGDRLGIGEILVAPTTSPPWTPLFGIASAVVTDTGGALSHCAIVAREYGIAAVVGTGGATAMIQDGQMIEVDGSEGTVRLL